MSSSDGGIHLLGSFNLLQQLTVVFSQSFGDLMEDPAVTGDHDDQWHQEQTRKREHVVGCFVPARDEASPRRALSEVLWVDDGHTVKKKDLRREMNYI